MRSRGIILTTWIICTLDKSRRGAITEQNIFVCNREQPCDAKGMRTNSHECKKNIIIIISWWLGVPRDYYYIFFSAYRRFTWKTVLQQFYWHFIHSTVCAVEFFLRQRTFTNFTAINFLTSREIAFSGVQPFFSKLFNSFSLLGLKYSIFLW